jgi:hypothetical protein
MILQFSTRNYGKILEEVKLFLMSIKNNLMFVSREKKIWLVEKTYASLNMKILTFRKEQKSSDK